jgi:hypothetical protein
MKHWFFHILFLASIAIILPGCGGSKSAASRGDKAFQSAPAETRSEWDTACAAIKANDYAAAITTLQKLSTTPGLSAEQTHAVQETATAVSDEMYAAANKGDARAKQAIADLRKLSGR